MTQRNMNTLPSQLSGWKVMAIGTAAALTLAACGDDDDTTPSRQGLEGAVAVVVNDESQAVGGDNCGGGYDKELDGVIETTDFSYKVDFFNASDENLQIGGSLVELVSTDSEWGVGEEATDFIVEHAIFNTTTNTGVDEMEANLIDGDPRKTFLLSGGIFSTTVTTDITGFNGTCKFDNKAEMPSREMPVITLQAGSTVEGYLFTNEDFEQFSLIAKNLDKFFTFSLTVDGNGYTLLAVASNGCDNPLRRLPEGVTLVPPTENQPATTLYVPPTEGTTPTTGNTTPTTGHTTPTTPGHTTPTTLPIHTPGNVPPVVVIPNQGAAPTPGYTPGAAEQNEASQPVIRDRTPAPNNGEPTENGTQIEDTEGVGAVGPIVGPNDDGVTQSPNPNTANQNSGYIPGSATENEPQGNADPVQVNDGNGNEVTGTAPSGDVGGF